MAVVDQIHTVAIVVSTFPTRCSKKFPSSLSPPSTLSNRLSGKIPTDLVDSTRDGDPRHLRPPDPPSPITAVSSASPSPTATIPSLFPRPVLESPPSFSICLLPLNQIHKFQFCPSLFHFSDDLVDREVALFPCHSPRSLESPLLIPINQIHGRQLFDEILQPPGKLPSKLLQSNLVLDGDPHLRQPPDPDPDPDPADLRSKRPWPNKNQLTSIVAVDHPRLWRHQHHSNPGWQSRLCPLRHHLFNNCNNFYLGVYQIAIINSNVAAKINSLKNAIILFSNTAEPPTSLSSTNEHLHSKLQAQPPPTMAKSVIAIAYCLQFREMMDYFCTVYLAGERSPRALHLTTEMIGLLQKLSYYPCFLSSSSSNKASDSIKNNNSISRKWWFEELTMLPSAIMEKMLKTLGAFGDGSKILILAGFLLHYLKTQVSFLLVGESHGNGILVALQPMVIVCGNSIVALETFELMREKNVRAGSVRIGGLVIAVTHLMFLVLHEIGKMLLLLTERAKTDSMSACGGNIHHMVDVVGVVKLLDVGNIHHLFDKLVQRKLKVRRFNECGQSLPGSYEHGYRVGIKNKDDKYYINNHLSFKVLYHLDPETDDARIVGFEVIPSSIKHEYSEWDEKNPRLVTGNANTKIAPGVVAMIMMRTRYRDITNYNQLENQDEAQEETGWKLVHGDVFRAPVNSGLLCVYVGTGVQLFGMTMVTMMFALLGFLSPSNRDGSMTFVVLSWVFMGRFAGYLSSRLYKMFKGSDWKKNTLKTAVMFPGIVFAIFFVLNALIWGEKSSGAVSFGTMFPLVFLWFGISVSLVFVGSYLGFKKPALEDPVKTNQIPRQIPEQAWYMLPASSVLIGGILPFGAVFIELFFILTSIWLNQFYYIFGSLFIVFVILLITCAEITLVLCYFQLCSEDYHWWWRAYLTADAVTPLYVSCGEWGDAKLGVNEILMSDLSWLSTAEARWAFLTVGTSQRAVLTLKSSWWAVLTIVY